MPPTSARADAARTRGIGRRWRNLSAFLNRGKTNREGIRRHHEDGVIQTARQKQDRLKIDSGDPAARSELIESHM